MLNHFSGVMAGLVPAIHVLPAERREKGVDARDKRGHDDRSLLWIDSMKSISRVGKAKRAHLGPFQVGTLRFAHPTVRAI